MEVRELVAYEATIKDQNFNPSYLSELQQAKLPLVLQAAKEERGSQLAMVNLKRRASTPPSQDDLDDHTEHATQYEPPPDKVSKSKADEYELQRYSPPSAPNNSATAEALDDLEEDREDAIAEQSTVPH